jgi:Cytosine deaminase and related metal-dependent hydrolases
MGTILIKGIYLNGKKQDIIIKDNIITKICDSVSNNYIDGDYTLINGSGKAAIPGFINMHTHSGMTLFRGSSEDTKLQDWLNTIWKCEKNLDDELIYWGTKLACIEMIKTGTTSFLDQYWRVESALKAIQESGIRSVQTLITLNNNDNSGNDFMKSEYERLYNSSLSWGSKHKFGVSVHAPYTVSDEMIVWCSEFATKNGLKYHIHVSETEFENKESIRLHGCSPFERLERLGALKDNVIAAHCVWLSENDIEIMAKRGVTAVHNINSNLKLSSGYKFLYKEMAEKGVNICLGTDGCASSNNLDMREAMKTAALLQKAWREDPSAMPLNDVFNMGTINGAKALNINAGEIKEGKLADLVLIDINNYAFTPNINFLSNLIYSANSSCVNTVICDGEILMQNRIIEYEQEVIDNVNRIYSKLFM